MNSYFSLPTNNNSLVILYALILNRKNGDYSNGLIVAITATLHLSTIAAIASFEPLYEVALHWTKHPLRALDSLLRLLV